MARKGNTVKEQNTMEEKPESKRSKKIKPQPINLQFLRNEKFHQVFGLFLVLLCVFLTIAFISFIFTWRTDFDKVSNGWLELLTNKNLAVDNWLGKTGAAISHSFIYKGFGISSFLFILVLFLSGFKLVFKESLLPFGRTIRISLFCLLFFSVSFGYIFNTSSNLLFLGGIYGFEIANYLSTMVGSAGTGLLLGFSMLSFMLVVFKFSIKLPDKKTDVNVQPVESAEDMFINTFVSPNVTEELPREKQDAFKEMDLEIAPDMDAAIKELIDVPAPNSPTVNDHALELEITPAETDDAKVVSPLTEVAGEIPLSIENIGEEETTTENNETGNPALPEQVTLGEYDPTLDLSSYIYPELDLLENYQSKSKLSHEEIKAELESNKNKIVETLGHYNIGIEKIKATVGPTVTLFEIVPQAGVRISKIKNLEDDIALSLSALGIRIIAPIPGKGTIGIEVPNQSPEMVPMKTVLASEKFVNSDYDLPIGLGKTISNEVFVADLAKMPHLLMAGATGQGKSVGLNAILVSLLYKKHPSQIKFILVDPKKVELTLFKTIERHFLAKLPGEEEAIITDTKKVVNTLNSLCIEMDQRYELLKDAQVRNIREYNAKFVARRLNPTKGHRFLPFIVLVVDEFADLIMTAGKEVEAPIARLAQLARAIGIHLIIATQRPSVNIITGTIKANFPARLAFRVTSKIDSRTILDSGGADQLIGRGDMLLSLGADLIRLQCAFVDTPEVDRITEFIGSQRGYPDAFLLPEFVGDNEGGSGEIDLGDRDPLFDDAARMVVQHQQGSASLLQRRLKLGYNRAGRLIDQLEAAGIIGPFEGSKAREVKYKDPTDLETLLSNLK
jgi:S-DNA-T family DNA segregation ATPase FtsK/SpoIIIE